jgi:hypothetical protein
MAVTRRGLLTTIAHGTGLLAVTLLGARAHGACAGMSADAVTLRLRALLSNPSGARRIGALYLQQAATTADATHLTGELLSALQLTRAQALGLRRDRLSRCFSLAVRGDFAAGRTVCLDGWLLSRTEARTCALWT